MKTIVSIIASLLAAISFGQTKNENMGSKEPQSNSASLGIQAVVEDENELYVASGVEIKPEYPGGAEAMNAFLKKNFILPQDLAGKKVSGKIFVAIVIEKDGSLTDLKLLREIGPGSGKELIRVINQMPKWSPGMQNGKKIRCKSHIVFEVN